MQDLSLLYAYLKFMIMVKMKTIIKFHMVILGFVNAILKLADISCSGVATAYGI